MTIAALAASCNKAEVIEVNRQAIAFGEAFVDNATKAIDPSFGTKNLIDEFQVWGTVTGNSGNSLNLYNGAKVTRGDVAYGDAFNCEQTEYWIPSATYNFTAISNATSVAPATGMPTAISYTVDGTSDLIYAEPVTVTTDAAATPAQNPVQFTFKHLLSKVRFTFTNESDSKATYKISNIKISGLTEKGIYTIGAATPWANDDTGTTELTFGNATNAITDTETAAQEITNATPVTSHFERLILPGEQDLTIAFTEEFYYNGILMKTTDVTKTLTHTFAANGAYNIAVTLKSGAEITFTVGSMTGWDADTNISIP